MEDFENLIGFFRSYFEHSSNSALINGFNSSFSEFLPYLSLKLEKFRGQIHKSPKSEQHIRSKVLSLLHQFYNKIMVFPPNSYPFLDQNLEEMFLWNPSPAPTDYFFRLTDIDKDFVFQIHSSLPIESGKYAPKNYFVYSHMGRDNTYRVSFDYRVLSADEKKKWGRNYQLNLQRYALSEIKNELGGTEEIPNEAKFESEIEFHLKQFMEIPETFLLISTKPRYFLENAKNKFIEKEIILKNYQSIELLSDLQELKQQEHYFEKYCIILNQILAEYEEFKHSFFKKLPFVYDWGFCCSLHSLNSDFYQAVHESRVQIQEWDEILNLKLQNSPQNSIIEEELYILRGKYLPVDSSCLSPTLQDKILSDLCEHMSFKDIFQSQIIQSDNQVALELLRHQPIINSVNLVYIDPPYNTGSNDFIYHDKISSDLWSLGISQRLTALQCLLHPEALFFASIDDRELQNITRVIQKNFKYLLDNLIWHKKTQPSYLSKELITVTEYIIPAKNTINQIPLMGDFGDQNKLTELINIGNKVCERILPRSATLINNDGTGILEDLEYGKGKLKVILLNGPISYTNGIPNKDLHLRSRFKWIQSRIDEEIQKGGIIHIKSTTSLRPTIQRSYNDPIVKAPITLLSKKVNDLPTNTDANAELKDLFSISTFDYSKPTALIKYLIRSATYFPKKGYILDFFAGSGTTGQACIELKEEYDFDLNYTLIEAADHYSSVLMPRIKKVMYSDIWKEGEPRGEKGYTHAFTHYCLEQPSDIGLNLISTKSLHDFTSTQNSLQTPFTEYHYEIKFEKIENKIPKITLNPAKFQNPFHSYLRIKSQGVVQLKPINLIMTFNYLLGLRLDKYWVAKLADRDYKILMGNNCEEKKTLIIWRPTFEMSEVMIQNEAEILTEYLKAKHINPQDFEILYMNDVACWSQAQVIEPHFLSMMFDPKESAKN